MKSITIPLPDWHKEGRAGLACLVLAVALNAFAIAWFHTPWSELITAWPYELAIAVVFYGFFAGLRLLLMGARRLRGIINQKNIGRKP